MLRYLHFDSNPTQRTVIGFCCSRVVFTDVQIRVPNKSLLFDNNYITNTFKKYRRGPNQQSRILGSSCGKCDGYGFYDWVTKLTTGKEEASFNMGERLKPVIVKNENPISLIYQDIVSSYYYYVSDFDQSDDLIYRCEQCLGTGMELENIDRFVSLTPDDVIEDEQPHIFRRISTWYNNLKSNGSSKNLTAPS